MIAIVAACVLLLIGVLLRIYVRPVRSLFVPASVAGGVAGLVLIQIATRLEPTAADATALADTWRSWPGVLIAIVFAGLLLEPQTTKRSGVARRAVQAGLYAWLVIVGEITLGVTAFAAIITHLHDVPNAFGQLIEAGFAGGHGTAAALGTVMEEMLEFPDGRDLGMVMATVGLVFSVVAGIVLVNLGVRRGWTQAARTIDQNAPAIGPRVPVAFGRLRGDVIDPLMWALTLVALAYGLGWLMQQGLRLSAGVVLPDTSAQYVANVPIFMFTLLGGGILRWTMTRLGLVTLIDGESIKRIVAVAMEVLIVAALASLRIEVVADYALALALLASLGCAWAVFCLIVLAPRILPRAHWFELGLINFGMSTGTTAQGMMLLRMVDPDLETGAAEEYAFAAPLSAPFVGGGVLTLTLPLILGALGAVWIAIVGSIVVVLLYAVARAVRPT